jgi:hypothetical protein
MAYADEARSEVVGRTAVGHPRQIEHDVLVPRQRPFERQWVLLFLRVCLVQPALFRV